ncbi:MAG: hypothetical protein ABFD83_06255 [Armatimonadota bacterium]
MRRLTYISEDSSGVSDYCLGFIFDTLGVPYLKLNQSDRTKSVDIYHGNSNSKVQCSIRIPFQSEDRLWSDMILAQSPKQYLNRELPFDLVSAIGAFLTDEVNSDTSHVAYDDHDRLKYSSSFQQQNNVADKPIVNMYVTFLGSAIEEMIGLAGSPLWPQGRKCAIGLSHDIDIPEKYAFVDNFQLSVPIKHSLPAYAAKYLYLRAKRIADKNPDEFWTFPGILNEETRRGFTSTMFFASTNTFGKWGSFDDVAYDIHSDKYHRIFAELLDKHFDVGLHAAYNTFFAEDRFASERQRLSEAAGTDVISLRHHYWHLGSNVEQTLLMHSNAGFRCDSSIAFEEQMGFRRSIALPYYPWISRAQKRTNCVQMPVFCMDGNLTYNDGNVDESLGQISKYVSTIKKWSGLGVFDWHERTSHPSCEKYSRWGEAYLKTLDMLASDNEIWVANLREITDWLDHRRKCLGLDVKKDSEGTT